MNRLYVVESTMTATGGKADHGLPLRYRDVQMFALELVVVLGVPGSSYPAIQKRVILQVTMLIGAIFLVIKFTE